jgi:hypothetical protein
MLYPKGSSVIDNAVVQDSRISRLHKYPWKFTFSLRHVAFLFGLIFSGSILQYSFVSSPPIGKANGAMVLLVDPSTNMYDQLLPTLNEIEHSFNSRLQCE